MSKPDIKEAGLQGLENDADSLRMRDLDISKNMRILAVGTNSMRDITSTILLYRETCRHIWNSYFLKLDWYENLFDMWDYFDEVASSLFRNTVLKQVFEGIEINPTTTNYYKEIRVEHSLGPLGYPAMWAKAEGPSYEWKTIQLTTKTNDFRFMEFFDWTTEQNMDCQFARAKLVASEEYPELINNDFILELWGVTFQTVE